jgi:hypothetical protein
MFEDMIENSDLSVDLHKEYIEFCEYIKNIGFNIESEGDKNEWKITRANELMGHINLKKPGIWIDICEFGNDSVDDALKETAWTHVRICEYFNSNGEKCGCWSKPGFDKIIFGKEFKNLCFALLEFINPDVTKLENIKKN